jgi:hypothetical protein
MKPTTQPAIQDDGTCKPEKTLTARDATKDETDWLDYEEGVQKKLGDYFLTAADKYNDIFIAVNTIYVGLLTLFGLISNNTLKILQFPVVIVFLLPVLAWIWGIFFFFRIKNPSITEERPNSPTAIRETLYTTNVEKARNYRKGLLCFATGLLLIPVALLIGSYWAALPAPQPVAQDVQIIFSDDTIISQIPIDLVNGTNKTVVISLVNTTDSGYQVKLANGDIVGLDKTWIKTIIYKPSNLAALQTINVTPSVTHAS